MKKIRRNINLNLYFCSYFIYLFQNISESFRILMLQYICLVLISQSYENYVCKILYRKFNSVLINNFIDFGTMNRQLTTSG